MEDIKRQEELEHLKKLRENHLQSLRVINQSIKRLSQKNVDTPDKNTSENAKK